MGDNSRDNIVDNITGDKSMNQIFSKPIFHIQISKDLPVTIGKVKIFSLD